MTGKKGTPRFASLFVTRKCNLSCAYCKSIDQPFKDIDLATWKQIIDKLYGFGCRLFSLTGGEPLMRKDITDIVRYICKDKKAICWIISNFGLMTEKKIDELAEAGMQFVTCSLDSLTLKGPKSSATVLDLLEFAKNKGIIPSTLTVITKDNIHEVPAILEQITRRGIMFDMGLYQHVGGLFSPSDASLKVTDQKESFSLIKLLEKTKLQHGLVAPSISYLKSCLNHYEKSDWKCSETSDAFLVVNNNGNLMVCQEHDSNINILSFASLTDPVWRKTKRQTVHACKGCTYGCYYQKEHITFTDALWDAWTMLRI
jgi:MoaA/NifB/PqqE/SkfB family radical SAM enzyme